MRSVAQLIFPSILAGSLFIFVFSGILSNPTIVLASDGSEVGVGSVPAPAYPNLLDFFTTTNGAEAAVSPEWSQQPLVALEEQSSAAEVVPPPAVVALEEQPSAAQVVSQPPPAPEEQSPPAEVVSQPAPASGDCGLALAVPETVRRHCEYIRSAAQESGLDPNLIAAVILQESRGNPEAYSSSGAVGLMQVMPRDGLAAGFMCINGPCFSGRPSMSELYDPAFNVSYGSRMLSSLYQKHGSIREALRAYGPVGSGYHYADLVLSIYQNFQ